MCLFCDWGTEALYGEEGELTEEAAERRRASQESWARLIEELARADAGGDKG